MPVRARGAQLVRWCDFVGVVGGVRAGERVVFKIAEDDGLIDIYLVVTGILFLCLI